MLVGAGLTDGRDVIASAGREIARAAMQLARKTRRFISVFLSLRMLEASLDSILSPQPRFCKRGFSSDQIPPAQSVETIRPVP